jgi:hypothetical protein
VLHFLALRRALIMCGVIHRDALLDPDRGYRGHRAEGLDFYIEHVTWKRLPRDLFAPFGGFDTAKELREKRGYGVKKPKEIAPSAAAGETGKGEPLLCVLAVLKLVGYKLVALRVFGYWTNTRDC